MAPLEGPYLDFSPARMQCPQLMCLVSRTTWSCPAGCGRNPARLDGTRDQVRHKVVKLQAALRRNMHVKRHMDVGQVVRPQVGDVEAVVV